MIGARVTIPTGEGDEQRGCSDQSRSFFEAPVRLNEEDRINRAPKSDSRAFLSAVLAITVTAGAALVAIPELRPLVTMKFHGTV